MSDGLVTAGKAQAKWNAAQTRILKYTVELYHNGLKEHKLMSAPDLDILQNKVDLQRDKWRDKWSIIESKRQQNEAKEASLEEASIKTKEAEVAIQEIENLLIHTLSIDDTIDWEVLKKNESYKEQKPFQPTKSIKDKYPPKPIKEELTFSLLGFFFKAIKKKQVEKNDHKHDSRIEVWNKKKVVVDTHNRNLEEVDAQGIKDWESDLLSWESRKQDFFKQQEEFNKKIDQMKGLYLKGNTPSIEEYSDMVLNNSNYPSSFPKNYELDYNPDNKILVVEYQLPSIECFPKIKEVKYLVSKKELKKAVLPKNQIIKMFDESIYKITLRSIHELFEADVINALEAISFNGWVKAINKATGKEENTCILSVQTKKTEFIEINLSKVDPKTCFKSLKGIASSKLITLTPIQPILQIDRSDSRFVEGYNVAGQIDASTNLAAMDWEDFEHLIRELFEKEFMSNGGDVKITQASRDGGVDAVAFDPDPIRGGKIVIQAKRYTNTVGVSAVRDLYGTLMNEGATKGILVSTADYGADAYAFAKGKPITLLNGSNLLHLLETHGYHAKIDLKDAKKILAEKERE